METERARAIAERKHAGDREENGALVLDHLTSDELRAVRLLRAVT